MQQAALPAPGTRIRLLSMPNDPCPIEEGATGTVERASGFADGSYQIRVKWDNGRSLMLVQEDRFEVIQ